MRDRDDDTVPVTPLLAGMLLVVLVTFAGLFVPSGRPLGQASWTDLLGWCGAVAAVIVWAWLARSFPRVAFPIIVLLVLRRAVDLLPDDVWNASTLESYYGLAKLGIVVLVGAAMSLRWWIAPPSRALARRFRR